MDEEFRRFARRAIVVNWKSMTQLSTEIPEWSSRLSAALGWDNLQALPRGSYIAAVEAIEKRYDEVEGGKLFAAARKYDARYVIATRDLGPEFEKFVASPRFGRYLLYDLNR
jgi:hypothetical protein